MLFHPYEIALCGLSGSGKTTLAASLASLLSCRRTVGYFKHGCHRFDIDREGKDSYTLAAAGAVTVMVDDPEKQAVITRHRTPGNRLERQAFRDCDLLLVEGLKELPTEKLLLVDAERRILDKLADGTITNVAALVVPDDPSGYASIPLPAFHRDSVGQIASFVESRLLERAAREAPLSALLLAGGRSSRMGRDKALIDYHGRRQIDHAAGILSTHCTELFISCRPEQEEAYRPAGLPLITDRYLGIGPLGGLLSAQAARPGEAWLLLACDMPMAGHAAISELTAGRNPFRYATAFTNPGTGRSEPLLACYEPKSREALLLNHAAGRNSLAAFLESSPVEHLQPNDPEALQGANSPEECARLQAAIARRRS